MLDVRDFLELFPEFDNSNIRPDLVDLYIQSAANRCPVEIWGDTDLDPTSFRNEAILHLAAHRYMKRLESMARLAAIASESAGGNAPQTQQIESDLKSTIYGAHYLDLAERVIIVTGFPL